MVQINKINLLLILVVLIIGGCDQKGENIPTSAPTANILMANGWDYYEKGEFQSAIEMFNSAKARDATKEDAYNGLGWAYAKVQNFNQSKSNFLLLLSLTESNTMMANAYAGLAMAFATEQLSTTDEEMRTESGSLALEYINKILSLAPNYQFQHDSHINAITLHATAAQCYFNLKDFVAAVRIVENYLESNFRQNLINNAIIDARSDIIVVEVVPETAFSGTASLNVNLDGMKAQIVDVISIKNLATNKAYQIVDFVQGGNKVTFYGNPIPQKDEKYIIEYENASDYGVFLSYLINTITQYQ